MEFVPICGMCIAEKDMTLVQAAGVVDGGSLSFLSGRDVHPGIAPMRASRSSGLENNMENWRRDDHQR